MHAERISSIIFPSTLIHDADNLYLFSMTQNNVNAAFAVWFQEVLYENDTLIVILFIQGTTREDLSAKFQSDNQLHPIDLIMEFLIQAFGTQLGIVIGLRKIVSSRKIRDRYCEQMPLLNNGMPDELEIHRISGRKKRVQSILNRVSEATTTSTAKPPQ